MHDPFGYLSKGRPCLEPAFVVHHIDSMLVSPAAGQESKDSKQMEKSLVQDVVHEKNSGSVEAIRTHRCHRGFASTMRWLHAELLAITAWTRFGLVVTEDDEFLGKMRPIH